MSQTFDPAEHREEVVRRWGGRAHADTEHWWNSLGEEGRTSFAAEGESISAEWQRLAGMGAAADGPQAQALAARHADWVQQAWGGRRPSPAELSGLGRMYVADERFAANYGGVRGAQYVCDALAKYADTQAQ